MSMKHKLVYATGIGLVFLAVAGFSWFSGYLPRPIPDEWVLAKDARDVIATCKNSHYRPACYDKEIPKLMDQGLSMEQAFVVTGIVQRTVHDYYYCHVLGHNLSAKETAKDPSAWTSVIGRCPSGICANGCLHGAVLERFRNDALTDSQIQQMVPALAHVCEPGHERNFTGLEQPICYHALGHLAVYVTDAHIHRATQVCDDIAHAAKANGSTNLDSAERCYEGAFMELYQFLEPEDIALVKGLAPTTTSESEKLCNSFTGTKQTACHRESWPLYTKELQSSKGLEAFCAVDPDPRAMEDCYNVLVNIFTARNNFAIPKITTLCEGLAPNRAGQCFGHAAARFIDTDQSLGKQAVALCTVASTKGYGERCFGELLFASAFDFHPKSSELVSFCALLPQTYSAKCRAGEGSSISRYTLDSGL